MLLATYCKLDLIHQYNERLALLLKCILQVWRLFYILLEMQNKKRKKACLILTLKTNFTQTETLQCKQMLLATLVQLLASV